MVQEDRAYHYCSMMQKKPIVDISNKKGMDSGKLSKDQSLLKSMPNLLCYPRVLDFEQLKSIAKAKEWTES